MWNLKEQKIKCGNNIIWLKTEAQIKAKSKPTRFGNIKSGVFYVDIVPNGEAVYLHRDINKGCAFFRGDPDGIYEWTTRLVPRAGQIHCLSLYHRALNTVGWSHKMIITRKENAQWPVIWAEKNDCMTLVNRVYYDKLEVETKDKDKKAELKAKRLERENKLREERGYPILDERGYTIKEKIDDDEEL